MKRIASILLGLVLAALFIASKTEWGRHQIGALFMGKTATATAVQPIGGGSPALRVTLPTKRLKRLNEPDVPGQGKFRLMLALDRDETGGQLQLKSSPARDLVQQTKLLSAHTDYLSNLFVLQKDIPIIVKRCGFVNAFWDPQARNITICDELIETMGSMYADATSEEDFRRSVMFTTSYFMFHEVGHALVDTYDLATFGRQEDVADQIATLLLLGNERDDEVMAGAEAFVRMAAARGEGMHTPFWDEHALDEQRFFNLVCWVYGSNPEKYESLVRVGALPRPRAARCPGEFADIVKGFEQHLQPHTRH